MKKLYLVELLRFVSSLSVLIYHYKIFFFEFNGYLEINLNNELYLLPFNFILNLFYKYGDYGVQMFWCISGFIMSYVYLNREKVTTSEFFMNRFSRLYPLHFITLILVTLIQILSINLTGEYQLFHFNDLYHFFLNLFFISGWGFHTGFSFNQPIWSVSMELIAYTLFFISLRYISRFNLKNFNLKIMATLLFLFVFIDKNFMPPNMNDTILNCLSLFILGSIVYYLMKKLKKLFFIILSILLILISIVGNFKILIFCPAILMLFIFLEDFFQDIINKPLFSVLGNVTYSTYLLHTPLTISLILIFKGNKEIYLSSIFFTIYFTALILLSIFVYYLIEKKLQNKIRSNYIKKQKKIV